MQERKHPEPAIDVTSRASGQASPQEKISELTNIIGCFCAFKDRLEKEAIRLSLANQSIFGTEQITYEGFESNDPESKLDELRQLLTQADIILLDMQKEIDRINTL